MKFALIFILISFLILASGCVTDNGYKAGFEDAKDLAWKDIETAQNRYVQCEQKHADYLEADNNVNIIYSGMFAELYCKYPEATTSAFERYHSKIIVNDCNYLSKLRLTADNQYNEIILDANRNGSLQSAFLIKVVVQ